MSSTPLQKPVPHSGVSPSEEEKKTFRQLNTKLETFVQNIRRLEEENERLKQEIEQARAIPDKSRDLENNLKNLRNDVEKLKADKKGRDRDADALEDEHTKLIRENVDLISKLEDAGKEKEKLKAEMEALERAHGKVVDDELAELNRLRQILSEKEVVANNLREEIQHKILAELAKERANWQESFKAEKRKLHEKYQRETENKENAIAKIEDEIHNLKVAIQHYESEANQLNEKIRELEEEIRRLKAKIAENHAGASTDPEINKRKADLEEEKKRYEGRIAVLKHEIQKAEDEIDELAKANIAFRNEIQAYKNLLEGVPREAPKPKKVKRDPNVILAEIEGVSYHKSPLKVVSSQLGAAVSILRVLPEKRELHLLNNTEATIPIQTWRIVAATDKERQKSVFKLPKNASVSPGENIIKIPRDADSEIDFSQYGAGSTIRLVNGNEETVFKVDVVEKDPSEAEDSSCLMM